MASVSSSTQRRFTKQLMRYQESFCEILLCIIDTRFSKLLIKVFFSISSTIQQSSITTFVTYTSKSSTINSIFELSSKTIKGSKTLEV